MKKTAKKTRLETANEKRDIALANLRRAVYERKLNLLAKYDVVDTANQGRRRAAKIETESEERILSPYDRLKAINLGRDAERNFSPSKALIKQFKINVVGPAVKMRLNIDDEELGAAVAAWFNEEYSRDCDARDDLHLSEQGQLALATVKREGDVGVVFDDFLNDDGKLFYIEPDQFVSIDESDWKNQTEWTQEKVVVENGKTVKKRVPLKQSDGVITDDFGRRVAYAFTSKRGVLSVKYVDATIIKAESVKLLKRPWRLNQTRGVADMLPSIADSQDLYEMRESEKQSAKLAAKFVAAIKKKDAIEDAILRQGELPDDLIEGTAPTSGSAGSAASLKNYENYEALTGGMIEYMEPDEDVEFFNPNRPNIALKDFFDFVHTGSGAGMGIAKTYSSLNSEKSYFAARGDIIMSWATFKDDQKWIERHFFDWVARRAIAHKTKKKKSFFGKTLPVGWERKISWIFPDPPVIDELKAANAESVKLGNLTTNYAEILGPDWKSKLSALAKQLEFARSVGLEISKEKNNQEDSDEEQNSDEDRGENRESRD